jgi:hypothetical protein
MCHLAAIATRKFCFELTDEPPEFILPAQTKKLRQKLERRQGRF